MAKGGVGGIGKLGKLKCMIKRWHAASGSCNNKVSRSTTTPLDDHRTWPEEKEEPVSTHHRRHGGADKVPLGLHPVYVGKSRRRYLVSSHLVDHPLFRVLVQRSGGSDDDGGGDASTTVVGCEVVLFEHLLWMLENADPQPESLDELVEFYAC